MKWCLSLLGLVIGGVITVAGASAFFDHQANPTTARKVTAADLVKIDNPEELSDWIYYDSPKIINTHVMYAMVRSRQVMSRFYLVQVEDRWLLAHVATEFTGGRIEGRLEAIDKEAMLMVKSAYPSEVKRLLPYQFEARQSLASNERQNLVFAGIGAVIGLAIFFSGLNYMFTPAPPLLAAASPQPASNPQPQQSSPAQLPPSERAGAIRLIFAVGWIVVFFFAAALIASLWAARGAGDDDELRKQLIEQSGKEHGPWVLLGSIVLGIVLSCTGILPGTGRGLRKEQNGST